MFSKAFLDVHFLPSKKQMRFKNDVNDIKKLTLKLKLFSPTLIQMEATGGYEKLVTQTLPKKGFQVCIANPRQIRDFAKALGKTC